MCNGTDQLGLLQISRPAKKQHEKVETCSASDDQKVQYIESELVGLSNWAIAEDVNEAMELVTGELEAEYEVIESEGLTIGTKSWTDRLQQVGENAAELAGKSAAKKVSKKFLSTIPFAGGILTTIVDIFWPTSASIYDIWQLIVGQVEKLVDLAILKKELIDRYADLLAIRRDLLRFTNSKSDTDRGNFLSIALAKTEDVMAHLTASESHVQFIPLTIATATIHCTILRLRAIVGPTLYGDLNSSWQMELQAAVAFYQSYFNYAYGGWYSWRASQLSDDVDSGKGATRRRDCKAKVKDDLTGEEFDVEVDYSDSISCNDICAWQKDRIVRSYAVSIVQALQPVMYLQRYIPGMESAAVQVLPAIKYVTLGPYAAYTQPISYVKYQGKGTIDPRYDCDYDHGSYGYSGPGEIVKFTIRSGADIDQILIDFEDGQSCIGGGSGGDITEPQLSDDKYISKLAHLCFNDVHMTHIEILTSDDENTSRGSGTCDTHGDAYVTDDDTYKLVGASLHRVRLEDSGEYRLGHMEPMFEYTGLPVWESAGSFDLASDLLKTGEMLKVQSGLLPPNNMYRFVLQEDANLVIYDLFDEVKWTSDTAKECGDASSLQLRFENDGNLVLYCGEEVLWQTQTDAAVPICRVVAMQNDGALAMYNVGNQSGVWSSTKSIPLGFGPSNLTSPHSLTVGMRLVQSSWKQFEFSLEGGKPTLKEWQGSTLWTSDEGCEASESTAHLRMQEDGNLVLFCDEDSTVAPWATNTCDPSLEELSGENALFLNADGNLVLINKRGETTWTSASGQEYQYFPPAN